MERSKRFRCRMRWHGVDSPASVFAACRGAPCAAGACRRGAYAADAVRIALEQGAVDENERNVLLAHQFVTGAKRCEAEELQVGDLIRSRWNFLKGLIMWHWDISTAHRKWEGRRCVTVDRRSNILSRKPVRKNPSRWSS